jgi:4-hydroxy-3-methylbut-2-enyl diphosphate reductase
MKVLRAEKLGFCFGVEDAIRLAQNATAGEDRVYSLGPLIHNQQVIQELSDAGLTPVESADQLGDAPTVIRAHGVPPSTMAAVQERSPNVIDATCILVRRAQNAVKQLHEEGYSVVIVGNAEHPEVKGIVGYAPGVTVVAGEHELEQLPKAGRLGIVGQTTLSQEDFAGVVKKILLRPYKEIKIINTLCLEVARRQAAAAALCDKVDVMFVLGGLHSANTRELARLCRERGVRTYHLESWDSFSPEYVSGCEVAGVTAGASTPSRIVDRFVEHLEGLGVTGKALIS